MIYAESHLVQTLEQVSQKPFCGFRVECDDISGWSDQPQVSKTSKTSKTSQNKSISQQIRSETPCLLPKRLKTNPRQYSMQVKYAEKKSDTDISFKDIQKTCIGLRSSLTPKLRNLINSINRAKINKMTENLKKTHPDTSFQPHIRISSISPNRRQETPGLFMHRIQGKNCIQLTKLKNFKQFLIKNLKDY